MRREGETPSSPIYPDARTGGAPTPGTKHKLAASGTWKDENTFEMTWRYYETPHHHTVTCQFDDDKVKITFLEPVMHFCSLGERRAERTPTAFHPSALGCRATRLPWDSIPNDPNPERVASDPALRRRVGQGFNPFRVDGMGGTIPRVGAPASRQPWAE